MSEEAKAIFGRRRGLVVGLAAGTVVALGVVVALLSQRDAVPPPTSAAATSTVPTTIDVSTTAPPTSPAPLADLSPFNASRLLSRTGDVPPNPRLPSPGAEFFVDSNVGNDTADGSEANPVATLEAAQRLARAALDAVEGDVVVYLREGVHSRSATFTLNSLDSGRGENSMIYRSYPGEQAVIEGGVQMLGWEAASGSLLVAPVPEGVADVRQFFAGGERQQRARTETALGTARRFVRGDLFNQQRNVAMVVDSALVNGIDKPENLELVYVGVAISGHGVLAGSGREALRPSWKAHRLPVGAAEDLGNGRTRLEIEGGALYAASERGFDRMKLLPGDPFFLENALELLDRPGEWYFDPDDRLIYWWPPDPAVANDAWIAGTEVLIDINGTPQRPVRNVRFEGLAFRHAGYTLPNTEGYSVSQADIWFNGAKQADWMENAGLRHPYLDQARPPGIPGAAVEIDSARDVTFTSNAFVELGAIGVLLENDVRRATFNGNIFSDISAGALVAGHPVHDVIDEPMEGPIADLVFTNNIVTGAAAEFYASVGVQVIKADGAIVSNNLFRDLPYSAISLGWGWNNNPASTVQRAIRVENNYFENVVNVLYDGAPIYLLGPVAEQGAAAEDGTWIRGNFANNAGAEPQFRGPNEQAPPDFAKRPGIQLDQGVRNVLIDDNVFTGATSWLQLTAWTGNGNNAQWAKSLALSGSNNWSDVGISLPRDLTQIGLDPVALWAADDIPRAVFDIIAAAGLVAGTALPPLP